MVWSKIQRVSRVTRVQRSSWKLITSFFCFRSQTWQINFNKTTWEGFHRNQMQKDQNQIHQISKSFWEKGSFHRERYGKWVLHAVVQHNDRRVFACLWSSVLPCNQTSKPGNPFEVITTVVPVLLDEHKMCLESAVFKTSPTLSGENVETCRNPLLRMRRNDAIPGAGQNLSNTKNKRPSFMHLWAFIHLFIYVFSKCFIYSFLRRFTVKQTNFPPCLGSHVFVVRGGFEQIWRRGIVEVHDFHLELSKEISETNLYSTNSEKFIKCLQKVKFSEKFIMKFEFQNLQVKSAPIVAWLTQKTLFAATCLSFLLL